MSIAVFTATLCLAMAAVNVPFFFLNPTPTINIASAVGCLICAVGCLIVRA